HDNAWIAAQLPIELAMADVERDDVGRAAPEQHVGEAASRGPDVERGTAGDIDAENVERVCELDTAAPDVGMIRLDERQVRVRCDGRAGLRHDLAIDADESRQDQPARA